MAKKLVIGVDLDGVVIDTHQSILNLYNSTYGDNLILSDITEWHMQKFLKPPASAVALFSDPDVYAVADPIPGAYNGLVALRNAGHTIVFITSVMPSTEGVKKAWLKDHNMLQPGDGYIETDDKHIIACDVLIDDKPDNVLTSHGTGIMFSRPWNYGLWHRVIDGVPTEAIVANNWNEVVGYVRILGEQHPTEERYPEQAAEFRRIIERMYRTHLDKNHDYGTMNVSGPGEIGIATRIWDKTSRLMNLLGWNIEVVSSGFNPSVRRPNFETLDDTYLDLAVHAIIGLIHRRGNWGK